MLRRLAGLLVLVVGTMAAAQDAGFEWVQGGRLGTGLRVFGAASPDEPLFVDAQRHVAVLARDRQSVTCLDSAYMTVSTAAAGFNETFMHVAYDASLSEVWLVSLISNSTDWHPRFTRYSCANGREAQTIDLPSQPIATLSDNVPFASWVAAPGVIEFSARDGLYRVDTSVMSPTAALVVSSASVFSALGESPPPGNAVQAVRKCVMVAMGARVCVVGSPIGQSVVTIDATGLMVTRREGPLTGTSAPMGTSLVVLPATGDVLVFNWLSRYSLWKKRWSWLGVVGADQRFRALRADKDTNALLGGGLNRLIPSADGTPWALIDGVLPNSIPYVDVVPVTLDPSKADFDLDGLSTSEELALGTSAADDDSDGDGVNDGVEVQWFHTDPLDAGSRPPKHEPAWRWGYNAMVGLPVPPGTPRPVPACPAHDPGPCAACREANGAIRSATGFCQATGGTAQWAVTRDAKAEFLGVKETSTSTQFIALQRISSDPVLFPSSVPVSASDPLFPVDENTVYQLGRLASGTRLVRFTAQGSEELSQQTGCPLARTVPGCDARLRLGELTQIDLLETLDSRPAVVAHVQGHFGEALVALDETGFHFLVDVTEVGLLYSGFGFADSQSDFVMVGRGNLEQRHGETWRMGLDFNARTLRRNELDTSSGPFRPYRVDQISGGGKGYPSARQEVWFVDPEAGSGTSGCVSVGGVTVCDDTAFPATPVPVQFVSMPPEELRPAEPALRAGDVLVATYLGTWTTPSPWGLSKMDREGTLTHWLSEAQFTALIDDSTERDALTQTPLAPIVSLAAAPDGLTLCLVEAPPLHRVWTVKLDPQSRVAQLVHRVPASNFTAACAFDAQGQLVIATDSELKRDGVTFASGQSGTQGVAWLGDRWVTWGLGRNVQCFDADGQSDGGLGWDAFAVAPFAGGAAWVEQTGRAQVGTLDELCNRLNVPRERFITEDRLTFNEVLSNDVFRPISRRRIQFTSKRDVDGETYTTRGALVMRPDGLGVFAAWNRWAQGVGFHSPLKGPDGTFFFEPALQPKDLTKRWPQFDPYRRAQFSWTMLAAVASPMALVPGADATGNWGRYGTPTPWVPDGGWPTPVTPMGGGDGATGGGSGGGGGTMNPPGCSCGQVDVAALALVALVWARRRRVMIS